MEGYERYGYGKGYVIVKREKLLVLFLLAIVAAFVSGMFIDQIVFADVSPETPLTGAGTGETVTIPAVIEANETKNESKAEIEKIDTDGDGMSDWFEEHYTHTDPKVANDRYLLFVNTGPLESEWSKETHWVKKMMDNFIHAYKFLPENVVIIENATFSDFKKAVDELAKKTGKSSDWVYIQIDSHGEGPRREFETIERGQGVHRVRMTGEWINIEPYMVFADESGNEFKGAIVTYKEIGEILDKIKCQKMLVSYTSCAGNTGVKPLNETLNRNPDYPRVIMGAAEIEVGIGRSFTREGVIFIEETFYLSKKNDYLSIKDYFQYDPDNYPEEKVQEELAKVQESIEKGRILDFRGGDDPYIDIHRVKIADPYNIAGTFYFGEAKVKDLYKPG